MYNIHFNLNLCAIYEFPLKLLKNSLAQQLKNIQLHLNSQTQGDIKCKSQLNKIKNPELQLLLASFTVSCIQYIAQFRLHNNASCINIVPSTMQYNQGKLQNTAEFISK